MTSVEVDNTQKLLVLKQKGSQDLKFPFAWLHHNCRCPKCFHPVSKARVNSFGQLDLNIYPKEYKITNDGDLSVIWSDDGCKSVYTLPWLQKYSFTDTAREKRQSFLAKPPQAWGSEMKGHIPTYNFNKMMEDSQCLYQWLVDMEVYGICLITDAPQQVGVLETLTNHIGILHKTAYGNTFQIETVTGSHNLAFLSIPLPLHTDQPYGDHPPGIQMLHCIKQIAGDQQGESTFCDGLKVLEYFKKEHPDEYKLLSTVPVKFWNKSKADFEFHYLSKQCVIELDREGELVAINYNTPVIDFDVPLHLVQPMYEAAHAFDKMLYDERCFFKFKLNDGEIVSFHNRRVMHGRSGFNVSEGQRRHLEGIYMNWDLVRSKRRVLEKQLKDSGKLN